MSGEVNGRIYHQIFDVQEVRQRLNQIAGQFNVLGDEFHLVAIVKPQHHRRIVVQTQHFQTNLVNAPHIVRLQIGRQKKILK